MYLQRILNLTFSLIFVRHTKRYIRELSNYRIRSSEKREGNIGWAQKTTVGKLGKNFPTVVMWVQPTGVILSISGAILSIF